MVPGSEMDIVYGPKLATMAVSSPFTLFASNLVAGDQNDHADVFLYRVLTDQLIRGYNTFTNEEGNGGSFYPRIDGNGSKVVFESKANNLDYNGITTTSKQILCGTPLSVHLEESMQLL